MEKRKNILMVLTDDQRADTIHALGNPEIHTPTLDRLVSDGCAFQNAHFMGGHIMAVCMPSRAMLMAGRPYFHSPMDLTDQVTMPQTFRENGYQTFATGKWHNGFASFQRSFTDASAVMFRGMSNHKKVPCMDYDVTGRYPGESLRVEHRYSSQVFSDAAIEFLNRRDKNRPFFLYLAYSAPHDPWMAPEEYCQQYRGKVTAPKNFLPEHPFNNGALDGRDEYIIPAPRTREAVEEKLADYYAMITHMDHELGRVLQVLRDQGLEEDTLIVFAGDNGMSFGSHGLMGKQNLYEESIKVPLIVSGAGVNPGCRSRDMVYLMDIFPTLCEMTGIEKPHGCEGKSFAGVLQGGEYTPRQRAFFSYKECLRCIKAERYKLIQNLSFREKYQVRNQLFDLLNDPLEQHDLASDPDYQTLISTMQDEMFALQQQSGDEEYCGNPIRFF